jgi:ABC-2 type transport system permease protein
MALLAIMYIFIYKALGKDIEQFKVVINNLPDVMKKALNLYLGSITKLEGFYSFVFVFVVLCGAIQAMNLGTGIVSKEIRDKTADFLMTKPVSRDRILTSKLLAATASLFITNIIYLVLTISAAYSVVGSYNLKLFLMVSVTLLFVQLTFMAFGIIFSVIAGKVRSVISVSISTVFGFYIIGTLGSVIGDEYVRYISPFRYFDMSYILQHSAYETRFIVLGIILIIASIAGSYLIYLKKDIHAV